MSSLKLPSYTITSQIEKEAIEIVDLVRKLDQVKNNPSFLRLRKANRIMSIHSSVAIEANTLTLQQVTDIINGRQVIGDAREILEVKNAWNAYKKMDSYKSFEIDSLLYAHKLISDKLIEESGKFRSIEVGVFNKDYDLIHEGAKPSELKNIMEKVFEWGKKSNLHPLIKSSVIHFLIEYVHPFRDGNGRLGRLWQTVILNDWNDIFKWLPIETMVYKNQQAYYDALHESEMQDDASIFVSFMLKTIKFTLDSLPETQKV
jgi:Fic family protein